MRTFKALFIALITSAGLLFSGCSRELVSPDTATISKNLRAAASTSVRGTFAGGPLYKPGYANNLAELKNSGLNTLIVWTIHIDANGNLNLNGEFPICANGAWIGNDTYPDFPNSMQQLKQSPTSIDRIEICILGTQNGSFTNIKSLIASQGTGAGSILYKNFIALKQAIPAITAVDFDDEATYDNTSTKAFAYMLGDIGYNVTMCPYTNQSYWHTLVTQINTSKPGLVDRIYLQCYDGGAFNNPCTWNVDGVPLYPGLWGGQDHMSPSQVQLTITAWASCVSGAWIWIYDDIIGSAAAYNDAIINGLAAPHVTPPTVP